MYDELVSIVVPIYNVQNYLKECIDSILKQTYKNLEVILVDDGSVDGSSAICDMYAQKDERVVVIHQKNKGVSCARNEGIKSATGKYISQIDSDDIVHEKYIEFLVKALVENNADVSQCEFEEFYDNVNNDRMVDYGYCIMDRYTSLKSMLYQRKINNSLWGKLYRKELIKKIECPEGKIYEDLAVIDKILLQSNRLVYLNEKLYFYRIRANGIIRTAFNRNKLVAIGFVEELKSNILFVYPNLNNACNARCFSLLMHLFRQIPNEQHYLTDKKEIYKKLKKYRLSNIINPKVRWKNKVAAIVSLLGYDILKRI